MSLLNTTDPVALRYLFDETLFLIEEQTAVEPLSNPVYWGGNQKNILFIHRTEENENLEDSAMDAFQKILTALKLQPVDVALLNIANPLNHTINRQHLKGMAAQPTGRIVFLGSDLLSQVDLDRSGTVHSNTPFILESIPVLSTFSFSEMLIDDQKKREFWGVLKEFLS